MQPEPSVPANGIILPRLAPPTPDTTPCMPTATPRSSTYVGRFAPSPTGPLHFGSLVTAVGSYLDARRAGGRWLLRIDDLDRARNVARATEGILEILEKFGFEWDGVVTRQSDSLPRYAESLERLRAMRHVFPCSCSRREMADSALARDGARLYPGSCRDRPGRIQPAYAWRARVAGTIEFTDLIQGRQHEDLESEVGDFVVQRADGQFAYQLAVVVDDHDAGVTHVIRGADLLCSTGRQIYLQGLLGFETPAYAHLPVVVNEAGEKLSKQTHAAAIDLANPARTLGNALRFLGHPSPAELTGAPVAHAWQWAIANWNLARVPRALQAAG